MEITLGKIIDRLEIFVVKPKGGEPLKLIQRLSPRRGSPGRIRTSDPTVNSRLLCQLSYWGIKGKMTKAGCILSAPRQKVNLFERTKPASSALSSQMNDRFLFRFSGRFFFLNEPILDRFHLILKMNRFVPPVINGQVCEHAGDASAEWNLVQHLCG